MQYTLEQKSAIQTIEDNLQIIACAGAGKTQVISQRIVEILKQGEIEPKNIIAFTYTEKAAAELKTRVLKLCREQLETTQGLAEMYIGTIHSWCLQAIQDNIFEYQKYSILDEIKLKLFVDKYYNRIGMASVGMKRFVDTGRFLTIMSVFREAELNEGIVLPEEWSEAIDSYQETLKKHSYFNFTTIMTESINYLQTYTYFQNTVFCNLKYLTVDKYLDVNPIQEKSTVELANSKCNISAVSK